MTERYVVFSHGKDSEPWGNKIAAMAEIAREEGFHVESVDYRGIEDPQARGTRHQRSVERMARSARLKM